jgi:hypothetical protein
VSKSVDSGISTSLRADGTAEGKGGGLTSEVAVGINKADVDLDGSMITGGDDAVGGRALAGNEKLNGNTLHSIEFLKKKHTTLTSALCVFLIITTPSKLAPKKLSKNASRNAQGGSKRCHSKSYKPRRSAF